ncbi:hypothetical protein MHK13_11505 [Corynebacterium hadale]|uniref:hypothetical protein n=1 Tax=Corynebacterium hadale TaxID=2026255 RepID=UPI001EF3733B|nr:hypothetical protein [Corynebacterium hadale]MCG7255337.1 hypothetical protein [Corynebacterium hadale]
MSIEGDARLFLKDVQETLVEALPLESPSDIAAHTEYNEDENIIVGEFEVPLIHGAGQPDRAVFQGEYSELFGVIVRYELAKDRSESVLAVKSSKFEIRVATAPGIRFEYERDYTSAPCAHIHYSGVAGLLSPALMHNFRSSNRNPRKKGRLEELHLPVGGKRFRPSLEDFLFFVVAECGFRGKPGWESNLLARRQKWLEKQTSAAVRDFPHAAARELRSLGFSVDPPADELPEAPGRAPW